MRSYLSVPRVWLSWLRFACGQPALLGLKETAPMYDIVASLRLNRPELAMLGEVISPTIMEMSQRGSSSSSSTAIAAS